MMIQAIVSAGLIIVSGYLIYRYIQYEESETAAHIDEHGRAGKTAYEDGNREDEEREGPMREDAGEVSEDGNRENEEQEDLMRGEDAGEAARDGKGTEGGNAAEAYTAGEDGVGRDILVRILTTGYESRWHEAVTLTCDAAYTVYEWGEEKNEPDAADGAVRAEKGKQAGKQADADSEAETGRQEDGAGGAFRMRNESGGSAGAQEPMQLAPGEQFCIQSSDLEKNSVLCVVSGEDVPITVTSIARGDGAPQYGGKLYLAGDEGGIALYNELPLEEYLCSVVSSEMPSDYPAEAQKAQAVCARTYAQNCMRRKKTGPMEEDLDDSVEFQVYNNYRSSDVSKSAVEATAGQTLPLDEVLYYSTDCLSGERDDLGSDESFARFLSEEPQEDAEYGSPWLRWEVTLTQEQLLENVREQYEFGDAAVLSAEVTKREDDGQAVQLVLCGEKQMVTVDGEYAVRRVLSPGQGAIRLRDGSTVSGMTMLPSAYFTVTEIPDGNGDDATSGGTQEPGNGISDAILGGAQEPGSGISDATSGGTQEPDDGTSDASSEGLPEDYESAVQPDEAGHAPDFVLCGGGYGHGIGMSQCGAAQMAVQGASYREILEYYYGCSVTGSDRETFG